LWQPARAEIEKQTSGAEILDAGGVLFCPDLSMPTPIRVRRKRLDDFERRARGETYEQIASAGGGIWSTVEKTRAATEDDLFAQAKTHAGWFLRGGTTTVEAKSGYGLTLEDELKILRVIRRLTLETPLECVSTFLGAHAIPREDKAPEYLDLVVNEMLPRIVAEKLAEFCDVFCERGYFDLEQSRKVLSAAAQRGLKLRAHVDQLTNSAKIGRRVGPRRPII
jgi:imidazolonepropionase